MGTSVVWADSGLLGGDARARGITLSVGGPPSGRVQARPIWSAKRLLGGDAGAQDVVPHRHQVKPSRARRRCHIAGDPLREFTLHVFAKRPGRVSRTRVSASMSLNAATRRGVHLRMDWLTLNILRRALSQNEDKYIQCVHKMPMSFA